MSTFLEPPPPGFHGAVAAMEALEPEVLQALVANSVLSDKAADPAEYGGIDASTLGGLLNALKYVFKVGAKDGVDVDGFRHGLVGAGLGGARVDALAAAWERKGAKACAAFASAAMSIPQLAGFDWKLGVSLSSSECSALQTGFVTVQFHVKAINGSVRPHTYELSMAEFESFHKQWQTIAQLMEANTADDDVIE